MDVVKSMCRKCGEETFQRQIIRPIGPHYGEQVCNVCGLRVGYLPKPTAQGKRKKNKYTPESLATNFCLMCLRDRDNLINYETLEVHHVVQVCDGGEDEPGNIWVLCTTCHRTVHFHRYYIRRKDGIYKIGEKYSHGTEK